MAAGIIRTGTCSWTEKTLVQSGEFYPRGVNTSEGRLRFYASRFDTVEVDSPYYAIPSARNTSLWAQRTPEGFTFHIKAYGALTGHNVDPKTLPAEIRELITSEDKGKRSIAIKENSILKSIADAFAGSLKPLRDSGKLGLVVFQFPPWFWYNTANMDYMLLCKEMMAGLPLAVEFRHGSWLAEQHVKQVMAFLQINGLTYVTTDEPQFGTLATVPFLPEVTTDTAYIRLHGRNRENWLRKGAETSSRYDYYYSAGELEGIAASVRELSKRAHETYVMFNNCHGGFAVRNAETMKGFVSS